MKKVITVSLLLAASLIILAACGHSRHALTTTDISSGTNSASSEQPQWLTDALAERQCPKSSALPR